MVKRKWLWGKRSSEKMVGETDSSGSMSLQSEKCSEDRVSLSSLSSFWLHSQPEFFVECVPEKTVKMKLFGLRHLPFVFFYI